MAAGEGAAEAEIFLHHVQVRMAHACPPDLYQDLAGAGNWLSHSYPSSSPCRVRIPGLATFIPFRGAGFTIVWPEFVLVAGLGLVFFLASLGLLWRSIARST
jgi:hypothetical protein